MSSGPVYVANSPSISVSSSALPTGAATESTLATLNGKYKIDSTTGAHTVIQYPHHEIHGGSSFLLFYSATVNDAASAEIRLAAADTTKWPHMIILVEATGETVVSFYETTTKTHVVGNVLTPFNANRNSATATGMTFCHTPAGSGDGTLLGSISFGLDSGTGVNRRLAGGAGGNRSEIILKQNTPYLLRVASGTDGNRINVSFDWYEHTNI